jgi:hypothetical protein
MLIRMAGALCVAIFGMAAMTACGGGSDFVATGRCAGSVADFRYDPAGTIKVETGGQRIAQAGTGSRTIAFDVCRRSSTLRAFGNGGAHYTRTEEVTQLRCRMPGGFFVHVTPTSSSQSGDRYDGSAVYLVVGQRGHRLIVASGAVGSHAPTLVYARRYCTPFGSV